MREFLQKQLTVATIRRDLEQVLADGDRTVELDGRGVSIPPDVEIEIVARSCHAYEVSMGFGDHFRVLAAIGGVDRIEDGVPRARLCFATLYYTAEKKLMTVDFASQMP